MNIELKKESHIVCENGVVLYQIDPSRKYWFIRSDSGNYYDDFVYEISSFKRYSVNNDFPKLTHRDLPAAIRKAMYEISLVDILDFEIKD